MYEDILAPAYHWKFLCTQSFIPYQSLGQTVLDLLATNFTLSN